MNVESLKSELQQVLDNDVELRKEFNALKRSLSDYRNQLIMRDEDCKRLQVTIDVLNTKLMVLERDNTNYKEELTSFKELRGSIKEQLQAKQDEIDARLAEIQSLRDDLNTMAASYEAQINDIRSEAEAELLQVKEEYSSQINDLKTNIHYKENGLRAEFENRVSELSINWADREESLILNHEEALAKLKMSYEEQLSNSGSSTVEQIAALTLLHENTLSQKEEQFKNELEHLRAALEEQRVTLTANFHAQVENLQLENTAKENALIAAYDSQLSELKHSHELQVNETVSIHEVKVASLIHEYEDKLSNTLIHSNSQNSKLNEELGKVQFENTDLKTNLQSLTNQLDEKNTEVLGLTSQLNELGIQLQQEGERLTSLTSEFELHKQNASLSVSEQVNELNQQIASLNTSHSDYVAELNVQIENLNLELKNLGLLFEANTNTLAETETALELKSQELVQASIHISELQSKLELFENTLNEQEGNIELQKLEIKASVQKELEVAKLEYDKLLAENTQLIEEIDKAQDKIEAQESEITILKGELDEIRMQSSGKTEYFKEILSNRNFEITNLEANSAALNLELSQLKNEVNVLRAQVSSTSEAGTQVAELQGQLDVVLGEKLKLNAELLELTNLVSSLNANVLELNSKLKTYESEIESLRNNAKMEEQEAFIDRLFKQIDSLNDQKLALLDEKEQMAIQLLKMNDVVGSISQQVDSERIDVSSLNNHRKNVILANNSDGVSEKPQMKEQINDLVREIDKCIALLSA